MLGEQLQCPEKFGPYTRLRTIGQGGSCVVVLCAHQETGEEFACKVVSKNDLRERNLLARFEQEVAVLQSFRHPNILEVQDVIEDETFIFLVLEYCPNGDLFKYIVMRDMIPEHEAQIIFQQLASAISYIHSHGIAHRDLKPENILLDARNNVKLADFGLCHKFAQKMLLKTPCGSLFYAPPEVVQAKKYDGCKGDVWSLGVCLYAMVTGSLPWRQLQPPGLYNEIVAGDFTIPEVLSQPLQRLLNAMLCVDPVKRASIDDVLNHPWVVGGCAETARGYSLALGRKCGVVSKSSNDALGQLYQTGGCRLRALRPVNLPRLPGRYPRKKSVSPAPKCMRLLPRDPRAKNFGVIMRL